MSTVFISHASEDADLAEDIYHALERAGYTAYLDKKALPVGQEYNVNLQDLVAKSDFFVFLISPESIKQGAYALTELQYAETKWRKQPEGVVPVMVREVETKALPAFLRQITFLSPKGNATAEVVSELNQRSQIEEHKSGEGRAGRSDRAKAYLVGDLGGQIEWYETKSAFYQGHHKRFQLLMVACAIAIPYVLYIFPLGDISARLIVSFLGASWFMLLVMGMIFRFEVKGLNYTVGAERMKRERRKYVNFTAPYTAGLGENRAFELFVENIEQIVQDERKF